MCPANLQTDYQIDGGYHTSENLEEVKEALRQLQPFNPKEYEEVQVKRARPLFTKKVYKKTSEVLWSAPHPKTGLANALRKQSTTECMKDLLSVFDVYSLQNLGSAWVSQTLPADLNIPVDRRPPVGLLCQGLLVADNSPVILCSVYDKITQETRETQSEYTVYVTRVLRSSLNNFCHRDFTILWVDLGFDNLILDKFTKAAEEQLQNAKKYFGGDARLSQDVYKDVCQALTILSRSSDIPNLMGLLDPESVQPSLVVLDKDWADVLSMMIELRMSGRDEDLCISPETDPKTKTAIVESAIRLAFSDEVTVFHTFDDTKTRALLNQIKRFAEANRQKKPKLSPKVSRNTPMATQEPQKQGKIRHRSGPDRCVHRPLSGDINIFRSSTVVG